MKVKANLPTMTRAQLIEHFAEKQGIPIVTANKIARIVLDQIKNHFEAGGRVEIRGLGVWDIKEVGAYVGRHPKTGEETQIPVRRKVTFRASKVLLAKINEPKEGCILTSTYDRSGRPDGWIAVCKVGQS